MPTAYSEVKLKFGTKSEYDALQKKDPNAIYVLSDVRQVHIGDSDYSSAVNTLSSIPTESTKGEEGRLYLCTANSALYAYAGARWVAVEGADVSVKYSITAGEGAVCTPTTITGTGTVSHAVPQGATAITPDVKDVSLNMGESFTVDCVATDKFGHVTGTKKRKITLPKAQDLSSVLRFKGSVAQHSQLPTEHNSVGDVYYVVEHSAEYVYLEKGWEQLGPVLDLSSTVQKNTAIAGYVASVSSSGDLQSAGYKPESGVAAGTYGPVNDNVKVPQFTVDKYGRITSASNTEIQFAEKDFVEDSIAWILEQRLS